VDIFNKKELELTIETLSNTNEFTEEDVIGILEDVFSVSVRRNVAKGSVINVNIDDDYNVHMQREYMVIGDNHEGLDDEEYNPEYHLYDDQAEDVFPSSKFTYGDKLNLPLKDITIDRHVTNIAKQQLKIKINEFNKNKIKEEFIQKDNELIPFIVKSYNKNGYLVELVNGYVGKIPYENLFRESEKLQISKRYMGMLDTTRDDSNITLTRKGDKFIEMLFSREVDDVFNEVVEVRNVCTLNGIKTIIAVSSNDQNIDPVGTCIGSRGVRVNAISEHLSNENLEIIKWNSDFVEFTTEYLGEGLKTIIVADDKASIIIEDSADLDTVLGFKHYKEKVISKFYNKNITVVKESEYEDDSSFIISYFSEALGLDDDSCEMLMSAGFSTIDHILSVNDKELVDELGLDSESIEMLKGASLSAMNERKAFIESSKTELSKLEEIDDFILEQLIKNNITEKNQLADMDSFELIEMIPVIDLDYAGKVIMEARN
jgi:transcription termination/antitermination protein NusA